MAVTAPVTAPPFGTRPPSVRHFARLKLRVLRNGLRGQTWRVVFVVLGGLFGLWFAGMGFLLFAGPGLAGSDPDAAVLALSVGGAVIVLGWLLLPLAFFGVDETLDPARFALLPLPRRTLVKGLLLSGLVGIPAAATAVATLGSVVTALLHGGVVAGIVQFLGVVAGLLLCVTLSRAVTSAFAGMLRSRRMRDLAAILLAVLAAMLGPVQIGVIALLNNANLDQMANVARVIGWTPFGAPYTVGLDVPARPGVAAVKLLGTVVLIALLLRWWSRSLEAAMVGTEVTGATRPGRTTKGGPVAQLFPGLVGWLPRTGTGALIAREATYWWRDARRRANLITIAVVGVFVPLMFTVGPDWLFGEPAATPISPTMVSWSMLFVGALAALSLANQFGFDGSAYAAHVIVGVPGRVELRARAVAYSLYMVPLLTAIAVGIALALGRPGLVPVMLGALAAAYGIGVAVNTLASVLAPYALPETSNPFAISTGGGMAKSLFSFVALIASLAAGAPFLAGAVLLGDAWTGLAVPVGLAYGVGAALLGCYIAGDVLDHRAPELVQTVSPRR